MEAILVIVGFLGAGKTTLLRRLTQSFLDEGWKPFILLNDYENAHIDSQHFLELLDPESISALSGSCICCSGMAELRSLVNAIPQRERGVTLIEANGTTDACELMGFLGVGLDDRFLPPVQISVVDARHWQERGMGNGLEASQIQVSSLVALNHGAEAGTVQVENVKNQISQLNPFAVIENFDELKGTALINLMPSTESVSGKIDHQDFHWSSCSVDLDDPMSKEKLVQVLNQLPEGILRVKGCTKLDDDPFYSFIERIPSGETLIRPYTGRLVTGPKLLTIGPGSDPVVLKSLLGR